MRYSLIEILLGAIVLLTAIGFLTLGMQSINSQKDGYNISLIFGSTAGLKNGDDVKISGINVGKITKLELNQEDYNAKINIIGIIVYSKFFSSPKIEIPSNRFNALQIPIFKGPKKIFFL